VRRIAKQLDKHLHAVALFVLESQEARVMLGRACTSADAKAMFLVADTPAMVRTFISDYDLLLRRHDTSSHLVDIPTGYCEINPFDKLAVLALWKFAAAKEAFELAGATPAAIGLVLEGMTCSDLAIDIDGGEQHSEREDHHLTQATTQAINETIAAKKQESKSVRSPAAKTANATLWGEYKRRALELANSKHFRSYAAAADFIQPVLQKELIRHASDRRIGLWIKAMGWRPTKIKT